MSAQATNEWKVGAFIVGGVALMTLGLFWLGANRLNAEVVERVTYFDESVQGLEVGAPIKIRGVTIGQVSEIVLAPDRRLVEVHSNVRVDALRNINALGATESAELNVEDISPELRIIVASQGITGVKFLEADFFPPGTPTIDLSFDAPRNYVPSAPSTLKSVEDAVRNLGDELPLALRDFREMAVTVDERLAALDTAALTNSIVSLSDELRFALDGSKTTGLAAELRVLMKDLSGAAGSIDKAALELTGDDGALNSAAKSFDALASELGTSLAAMDTLLAEADVPATAKSFRAAADAATRISEDLGPATQDLPAVLRDLRATLKKFEALASLVERDPGVFLRGRSGGGSR